MTYEAFKETMLSVVKTRSPEYYPELVSVSKMNGQVRWGIQLQVNTNVKSVVYLEEFYQELAEGVELSDLMDEVWWKCLSATNPEEIEKFDVLCLGDYEKVKDSLYIRACGIDLNKEMLREMPYIPKLDIALFAYYRMDGGVVKVTNDHLKIWKRNADEVLRKAVENSIAEGLWWATLEEVLCRIPLRPFEGDLSRSYPYGGLIFSNKNGHFGASSIFLESFSKEIGKALGGSYYILPCSIHETLVLPASGMKNESYLKETVNDINRTEMDPEEVLSNSVYFYNAETDSMEIIKGEENE